MIAFAVGTLIAIEFAAAGCINESGPFPGLGAGRGGRAGRRAEGADKVDGSTDTRTDK